MTTYFCHWKINLRYHIPLIISLVQHIIQIFEAVLQSFHCVQFPSTLIRIFLNNVITGCSEFDKKKRIKWLHKAQSLKSQKSLRWSRNKLSFFRTRNPVLNHTNPGVWRRVSSLTSSEQSTCRQNPKHHHHRRENLTSRIWIQSTSRQTTNSTIIIIITITFFYKNNTQGLNSNNY